MRRICYLFRSQKKIKEWRICSRMWFLILINKRCVLFIKKKRERGVKNTLANEAVHKLKTETWEKKKKKEKSEGHLWVWHGNSATAIGYGGWCSWPQRATSLEIQVGGLEIRSFHHMRGSGGEVCLLWDQL